MRDINLIDKIHIKCPVCKKQISFRFYAHDMNCGPSLNKCPKCCSSYSLKFNYVHFELSTTVTAEPIGTPISKEDVQLHRAVAKLEEKKKEKKL